MAIDAPPSCRRQRRFSLPMIRFRLLLRRAAPLIAPLVLLRHYDYAISYYAGDTPQLPLADYWPLRHDDSER